MLWPAIVISHFKEKQVGKLFQVIAKIHANIAKRNAEGPDFGYYGVCIITQIFEQKYFYFRLSTTLPLMLCASDIIF